MLARPVLVRLGNSQVDTDSDTDNESGAPIVRVIGSGSARPSANGTRANTAEQIGYAMRSMSMIGNGRAKAVCIQPSTTSSFGAPGGPVDLAQLARSIQGSSLGSMADGFSLTIRQAKNGGPDKSSSSNWRTRGSARPSMGDWKTPLDQGGVDCKPSASYLRQVAVPSRVVSPRDTSHLCVLSLDGLLACHLPPHLSDGYVDYLGRPYLHTLLDYIMHRDSSWAVCFYTSLPRTEAMKVLRQLKMPTGSQERDDRDGVMGLFAKEDMKHGWDGGELEIKDLEWIWSQLVHEENVTWDATNTVLVTGKPPQARKQPSNMIFSPLFEYQMTYGSGEDQYLLMLMGALVDLSSETNVAYHVAAAGYNAAKTWEHDSHDKDISVLQNKLLKIAVRTCAQYRLPIVAWGPN